VCRRVFYLKKKKQKSVPKLVEEAAVILQRIVRMKAANDEGYCQCVTCGTVKHWTEMHGGHFLSRRHLIHKIREENIHPCCPYCNNFLRGNLIPYTTYMIDTYGRDFVDNLIATKNDIKKYNRAEINQIICQLKIYEIEIKELKGF
jgi:Bacteriophage Lambda NinG protein